MRNLIFYFLIAVIPTGLFSNTSVDFTSSVRGSYFDRYSDTEIQIKSHRKGIKARVNGSKWRTYNYMGGGVFDDCNGRVIVDLGRGEIEYRKRRNRRPIVLTRNDHYYDTGYRNGYSNSRSYGNNRNYYECDQFCGDWGNTNGGYLLSIERYGNGFRARIPNEGWTYYNRYNDREFRDRRGNRYFFDGVELIWSSGNGRKSFRFRRG